jgi:hypothetical protein
MRGNVGTGGGNRQGRLIRSDIFQICVGLVLAVFLFQADRTISALGADGAPSHAVIGKDAMTVSARMVQLECVRLAAALNRMVSVTSDANACHFIAIFE